jgi:hypothetical protein
MPSATIPRAITAQEAAEVLKEQLGSGYKVTPHTGGSRQKLTVSHGGVAFATVHLVPDGNATTFHVHGGGLIVGRLVNEFGIARKVTAAIEDSLGSAHASSAD